jgi:hypothetical protein
MVRPGLSLPVSPAVAWFSGSLRALPEGGVGETEAAATAGFRGPVSVPVLRRVFVAGRRERGEVGAMTSTDYAANHPNRIRKFSSGPV